MCLLNGSGEDALVESAARAVRDGLHCRQNDTFPNRMARETLPQPHPRMHGHRCGYP